MTLPLPWSLLPELSQDRLQTVAGWLLDEQYSVLDDLNRPTDSGYTQGCTAFGRQKNRIWLEHASGQWGWLSILNPNNDMVFAIGGVPCRFSNDDPQRPTKSAVIGVNRFQTEFQEFTRPGEASRFCFVLDRGVGGTDDPRVVFLGYDSTDVEVCRWVSDMPRALYAESVREAPEVPVERAPVKARTVPRDAEVDIETPSGDTAETPAS